MMDQGVHELDRARRKAAERAGVGDKRCWPNNEEIHEALVQRQRLLQGDRQERELRGLLGQALAAMRTFAAFAPRLVGPVLSGSADASQGVRLHLFTDNTEEVVILLLDQQIPWLEREGVLRYGGGVRRTHPVFSFFAGETPFELLVLPVDAQRNPPLSSLSERPDRGADAAEVKRLLGDSS